MWCSLFTEIRCDLEAAKTEDTRQCTLCQQYGDSAPSVSLAALCSGTITLLH